jgi:DNA-binding transcriptional ArsR family regulator
MLGNSARKMTQEPQIKLTWDSGTAYDLFLSLEVLHNPADFDLRGSWAAGVRSRVPAAERKVLEDASRMMHVPLSWIYGLPGPKDGETALWTLSQIPAAERLPSLLFQKDLPEKQKHIYQEVSQRGAWNEDDLNELKAALRPKKKRHSEKDQINILNWWSRPDVFGERYLAALRSYHREFFAEEETRIRPALEAALAKGQEVAQRRSVFDLVEDLSQGVHFTNLSNLSELILAPSYWTTPLIFFEKLSEECMLITYGARPANASLVPGELVPDALLRGLKALADTTRLRILRLLVDKPLTPAELSRLLRLRAPTVVHHLHALRIAGLVHLYVEEGGDRRYAVRRETTQEILSNLDHFLSESRDYRL